MKPFVRGSFNRGAWLLFGAIFAYPGLVASVENVDHVVDFRAAARGLSANLPSDYEARDLAFGRDGLELSTLIGGAAEGVFDSGPWRSPFDFTALGPHWRVHLPEGTWMRIELSTSADGVEWSERHEVHENPHLIPAEYMPDGTRNPNHGDEMGTLTLRSRGDGRFVRFWIHLGRDATARETPRLERFALALIDSREPDEDPVVDAADRGATTLQEAGLYPKPPVHSRAAWGARASSCTAYCNVTHIAIHHTAAVSEYSCSGFDDCAADVRATQSFHMDTNGWCDVGYNYLASSDGQLWEGRGGGDDIRGAHDSHNCGSMAISNMGYYHPPYDHFWTEAQLESVSSLAAWKADQKGIDPYGVSFYSGFGGNMDNIYGHRDVGSTACPGDSIWPRLGELRDRVSSKINGGGGNELIFDNPAVATLVGAWETGTSSPDKYGSNYYWTSTGTADTRFCVWSVNLDAGGTYDVSMWWPDGSNRTPAAEVGVKQASISLLSVDQQVNGGQWNSLGTFSFTSGTVKVGVRNGGAAGWVVMCDAIRLTQLD